MGADLTDALRGSSGHLGSLMRVVTSGVAEEQAAAHGLLGDLPEWDLNLTRQLLDLEAGGALYRVTCALQQQQEEDEYVEFAREAGLALLFVKLLRQ
jgi:hypothetical protein